MVQRSSKLFFTILTNLEHFTHFCPLTKFNIPLKVPHLLALGHIYGKCDNMSSQYCHRKNNLGSIYENMFQQTSQPFCS